MINRSYKITEIQWQTNGFFERLRLCEENVFADDELLPSWGNIPQCFLKNDTFNNRIYMYSLFLLFCVQAIQLNACSVLVEILYLSNFAIIKWTCIRWIGSWCKWLFNGRWWLLQKEVIKPSCKTQLSSQRCEDQHEQLHITLCRFT